MKSGLTEKEWTAFVELLNKATNKDLYEMQSDLEKEIKLSEQAIVEGFGGEE